MQEDMDSVIDPDSKHGLSPDIFEGGKLPSYAGAAIAKTPVGLAFLLVTSFWAISSAIVLLAVRGGGAVGALTAGLAVLALYIASGLIVMSLRRAELRKIHDLVDVLNNTSERLANLSTIDELTNIYNRRYFYWQLDRELDRSRRYNTPFALILFDIDNLKSINDGLGHLAGDELLRTFGSVLCNNVRSTDICARIGGDEFAILATGTTYEAAAVLANRLTALFANTPVDLKLGSDKAMITGTATWGLSAYSPLDDGGRTLDATDIIWWADQDLSARKVERHEAESAAGR